jgi:hypothetical protein
MSRFRAVAATVILALALGASNAAARTSPLVGFWACTGQSDGLNREATFDYRADGTYIATQRISAGNNAIEGGGGGTYTFVNGVLSDTKLRASLDRYVRNGVDVPSSDPEFQMLYAQSQANIGTTTTGEIRIEGDVAYAGIYTCQRQR